MKRLVLPLILMVTMAGAAEAASSKVKTTELPDEAKALLAETQGETAVIAVNDAIVAGEAEPIPKEQPMTAEQKAKAAENEIPLHLDGKKSQVEAGDSWTRITAGFAVLAVLLLGAWIGLRRIGKPSQRKNAPQIKVLNQHFLGPKKSLAIIRVAGESILIGVTDQNISLIKPLSLLDDEVPEEAPSQFTSVLDEVGLKDKTIEENEGEEFQMTGLNQIKDVVSRRLKNMRSIE